MNGLQQAIDFIGHEQGTTSETHYQPATTTEEIPSQSEEIKIDIDFKIKRKKSTDSNLNYRNLFHEHLEGKKKMHTFAPLFQAHRVIYHIV